MKHEPLTFSQALALGKTLPFALIRTVSAVSLGPTPPDIAFAEPGELLEARFFSPEREVRVFPTENGLAGALLEQEPEDDPLRETFLIENPRFGGELTVCHFLDTDADGQTRIAGTRLAEWKEARQNG